MVRCKAVWGLYRKTPWINDHPQKKYIPVCFFFLECSPSCKSFIGYLSSWISSTCYDRNEIQWNIYFIPVSPVISCYIAANGFKCSSSAFEQVVADAWQTAQMHQVQIEPRRNETLWYCETPAVTQSVHGTLQRPSTNAPGTAETADTHHSNSWLQQHNHYWNNLNNHTIMLKHAISQMLANSELFTWPMQ